MADTIFALASGSMRAAVAIVRVSGPAARQVGEVFCGRQLKARFAHFNPIQSPETGELLDMGLVLFFPKPQSFTGEDCLEFQVHGSEAVIRSLLAELGRRPGLRMAEPGEFIRRAFENGKMPLTSVEGLADLIDARTDAQRRQALAQAGGSLARRAEIWRGLLLEALALLDAEIDFADEGEAPVGVLVEVRALCGSLVNDLESTLSDAVRAERVRNGFRVVIAGLPNAGKSSLLNALVRRDVAIVTEHAGTTRDVVEVEFDLGGFPVVISDTAGLRDAQDPVEAIGVGRSRQRISTADLVLWLQDTRLGSRPEIPEVDAVIVVATKCDLGGGVCPVWADISISLHDGTGLDDLFALLTKYVARLLQGDPPAITHDRQKSIIQSVARQISMSMAQSARPLEIVADDLKHCAKNLQELTGIIDSDDILGSIFSRFCMGK